MNIILENSIREVGSTPPIGVNRSFDDPKKEIKRLEDKYNQGKKCPKAFEELLFVAGKRCWARETPRDYDRCNDENIERLAVDVGYSLGRPFFVFEDGEGDYVRFFYLDEDEDDPKLYDIVYNQRNSTTYELELLDPGFTLVGLIEKRVRWNLERLEKGWGY